MVFRPDCLSKPRPEPVRTVVCRGAFARAGRFGRAGDAGFRAVPVLRHSANGPLGMAGTRPRATAFRILATSVPRSNGRDSAEPRDGLSRLVFRCGPD